MNFKSSTRKKLTAMTILMVFVINICSVNVVEASTLFKNTIKLDTRNLKSNNEVSILHYDTKDDKETDKKIQTSNNTIGEISENKYTSQKENISKDNTLEEKLKNKQSIVDYNKIDIALSGILQENNNVEINTDYIKKIKDIVPKENGIYILAKDREAINSIINNTLGEKYYIDEEGFIKKNSNKSNNLEETEKSKEYSKIIENILSENKKVIIAKSEKWAEYNDKEQKIEIKNFNSNKKSVKFSDKIGRDLLILNGENELNLEESIFKELKNISTLKDDSSNQEVKEDSKNNDDIKINDKSENESDKKENSKETNKEVSNGNSNEEVKEDSKNNDDIKINDESEKESDKKENSTETNKEISNGNSNEEKNIDSKNDKKIDEDIKEKEKTLNIEDEDKHITKNLDIFDVAIVGLLGNEKTEVNEENINKFKNVIPKGNGVWILEKDRKGIINIINNVASKEYYIDNNGFLRCTGNNNKNTKNSKICSGILDKLINSDKVTIIGRDNGWNEYSVNEEKVINKKFTDDNAGVTIGGKGTNQLIILSEKAKDDENMAFVLFHELIHGLRGQEGKKDRLEEELFAGTIENYIRKELGYSLRDLSNLEKAYKDYTSIYRDDWNRIAFEYSQAFFGTIKLKDPTSLLNIRSTPSTSAKIIGSLAHGTSVSILDKSGDWYKISYNGKTGYIKGEFLNLGSAEGATTGTIRLKDSSSSLNMRSGPSTNSNVVGSLPHGTVVNILGTSGQWYKISYNGKVGYVRGDYLTLGGAAVGSGSGTGTIKLKDPSSSLNVRSGPSTNTSVVGSLPHGTVVQITGKSGDWYKINFNGTTGYVKVDFVTLGGLISSGNGTVTLKDPSSALNVRSSASITSNVVGSLAHGTVVKIIGTEGEWYKIEFNGGTGYVKNEFITKGGTIGSGNGTIVLQDPSSSLNVRNGASLSSGVIGSLSHGSVVEIIGTEGQWYKIKFNGKVGYVRSDYVVRGGSLSIGSDKYESSFKDGYIRYYAQDDPRYGNIMYSNHGDRGQTIANSACGPSAFSIVVSTLNNIDVPPTEICRYALSHGYRTYNEGTSRYLFSGISNDSANPRYNLNYQSVGSISGVKSILSDNKHLVIVSMRPGHVTQQGHYIVLAGYTTINGKVYFKVYDPHRWNEFYIYDGEIIDTVKDDGFILLSQNVIMNESQGYFAFSSKNGSALKPGSGSSSSTNSSHSSSSSSNKGDNSSSGSSSSNNSSSKKPSGKVEKKEEFDPSKMFETIKLNINNYEIDYRWEYFNGAYRLMPIFDVKNLEKLHHAYAPQVTPSEFVSMIISFTPLDAAKDFIDFIYGKDIVTNDKINRGVLFACIFLPDVADELIKKGVKNSDELVKVFKGVEKKFTINNAKQVNTKNPLSNIKYTEKVKKQATQADYHGFPESVDGFGACGKITNITGGDGIVRKQIEIPGSYMGKEGVFQYIIEADGVSCNHRLFVPNK